MAATQAFNDLSPCQGFQRFDHDGDGFLSYEDLLASLIVLPVRVTHADVNGLHTLLDTTRDGLVRESDFTSAMLAANPMAVLKDMNGVADEAAKNWMLDELNSLRSELADLRPRLDAAEAERSRLQKMLGQTNLNDVLALHDAALAAADGGSRGLAALAGRVRLPALLFQQRGDLF